MTAVDVTPSGVPSRRANHQTFTGPPGRAVHYERSDINTHRVTLHAIPPELRVTLEWGLEDDGAWVHIPELDISGEGQDVGEALQSALSAARDWLIYLREDGPDLAPEVASQRRYVALLDFPYGWFKNYKLVVG